MKKSNIIRKSNFAMYFLLFLSIFGCQKSELTERQTISAAELKTALANNSSFNSLVTSGKKFVSDLTESENVLSKEQSSRIAAINLNYPTLLDFNTKLEIEDKNFLLKLVPQTSHGIEFKRLCDELNSKYIYELSDLNELLLQKIISKEKPSNSGRTNSCGAGCCEHQALAMYYFAIQNGMNSDYAGIYAIGYYHGCLAN
jgi:hypothetical protein